MSPRTTVLPSQVAWASAERGPAYEPLPIFAVRVVGDEVQVERRRVISQGIPPHLRKVSVQDDRRP